MKKGPFLLRRLGRRLLWGRPALYRHVGKVRGRGDCFDQDFDLWLGGFPRSANTFAVEAFQWANPTVRLASHRHLPPFIIHWLDAGRPGIFLIREPEDAVISWAILWGGLLEESLDYYIDFHRALLPQVNRLFVAPFDKVTQDFGEVVEKFNQRFGTRYSAFEHAPDTVKECFSRIEKNSPLSRSELRVCRPSPQRSRLRPGFRQRLRETPTLIRKLAIANELYAAFTAAPLGAPYPKELLPAAEPAAAASSPSSGGEQGERWQPTLRPVPDFALCFTNRGAAQMMQPVELRDMLSYLTFRLKRYTLPVLFVGLALLLRLALEPVLKGHLSYTFFFAAIVLTAWTSGTSETFFSVLLGFLAAEWFVVPPMKSLAITSAQGWWGAGLYFFIGLGIVWFMKSKQSARLMALSSAVEARRRLEEVEHHQTRTEQMEQRLETLTAIIESAQYPLLSVDPSGRIATWNGAAGNLFGYSAEEALGQPLSLLVSPQQQRPGEDLLASLNPGERSGNCLALVTHKEGSQVPVWLTVSPLKSDGGKALGSVIVARPNGS